jgi:predicted ATPase
MEAKLLIQNFGAIKHIDIQIRKFNILIGPHATGKSTISKVLSIIHSFDYNLYSVRDEKRRWELLNQFLVFYRVENFYQINTYWLFEDERFRFEVKDHKISYVVKENQSEAAGETESYYFPAERIALPMINESLFELNLSDSSLPKYFLQFGNDFMKAKRQQKVFNLPLLNVEFEYQEGKNLVILGDNKLLFLEETSSAIQANLPLLVIMQYPIKMASLFVVEELELHAFPLLQKKLLYYIIERMKHPKLKNAYVMLPTHSPYILSAANNLLFASKVGNLDKGNEAAVHKIIPKKSWIDKEDFSAYFLSKGKAVSIVNKSGLIDQNKLDGISDDLAGELDQLMELYNPANA